MEQNYSNDPSSVFSESGYTYHNNRGIVMMERGEYEIAEYHYKRATTTAMQLAIANCGGFVTTFIYPNKEKPSYFKSHSIVLGLLCYAWAA